jgi:hypothetical protein
VADRDTTQAYETLLYILTPLILPICFMIAPIFSAYLFAGTVGLYLINSIIFNEIHLRLKKESVSRTMLLVYYVSPLLPISN